MLRICKHPKLVSSAREISSRYVPSVTNVFFSDTSNKNAPASNMTFNNDKRVEETRKVYGAPVNRNENISPGKRYAVKHFPLVTDFYHYQLTALTLVIIFSSCVA